MVQGHDVFLHFVELLRQHVGHHRFSAIHHPGLQSLVHLRERQRLRNGPDGTGLRFDHFRRIHADFHALEVSQLVQGAVGGNHAKAGVPIRQAPHTTGIEPFEQLLPILAGGHLLERGQIGRHKGQVKDFKLLHAKWPELGDGRCQHLHRPHLQGFQFLLVLEQGTVGVNRDFDAPLGALFGQLFEALGPLALGCIRCRHMAELDVDGLLRPRLRTHKLQRHCRKQNQHLSHQGLLVVIRGPTSAGRPAPMIRRKCVSAPALAPPRAARTAPGGPVWVAAA